MLRKLQSKPQMATGALAALAGVALTGNGGRHIDIDIDSILLTSGGEGNNASALTAPGEAAAGRR